MFCATIVQYILQLEIVGRKFYDWVGVQVSLLIACRVPSCTKETRTQWLRLQASTSSTSLPSVNCVDAILSNGVPLSDFREQPSHLASGWVVWGPPPDPLGQQLNQTQPSLTHGSLSWLQKMASSVSVSSITKSPHCGQPYRFQEVSSSARFPHCPSNAPQFPLSLPALSPSLPPPDPSCSPKHSQSHPHNLFYFPFPGRCPLISPNHLIPLPNWSCCSHLVPKYSCAVLLKMLSWDI